MSTQPPRPCPWPPADADHLLVSGAQMASLEQELFASGLPVEALMEKAALAVARAIVTDFGPTLALHGALVLVGPGHNGGDGLVIARELHLAGIRTAFWCPFERLKPLTAAHQRHALWLGIGHLSQAPDPGGAELWIDALFGIGQHRPLDGRLGQLLCTRQACRPDTLVAVDLPSGLDDTSGRRLGNAGATAAATYTIGLIKQGLVQDPALAAVGRLQRIDLGLPTPLLRGLGGSTPLALGAAEAWSASAPWPPQDPAAGKYDRGRLLVIAGSEAYRGAAHLALLGASASGAGSLRAALSAAQADDLWQLLPHVVLQRRLPCNPCGSLLLGPLTQADLSRLDAVLLGPGIGPLDAEPLHPAQADDEQAAWQLLQAFAGLLVLDADGLNRTTVSWLQHRRGPTWITPHQGELSRLWPALAGLPPLEAARVAAADSGAVVLLKGARSVIAAPDGRRWQLLQAAPESARAGLGDVLAGYAAGRGALALARTGPDQTQASWLAAAALEHAQAGLSSRWREGPGGVTPQAVARALAQRETLVRPANTDKC